MKNKKCGIALLAHVDAGKTTLSEGMLYLSGAIRKLGRVDHRDTFLDTNELERERGITIFSKQARITWKDMEMTLLDTPGHVDFSAEMERTLQVLDVAILVISGSEGVQGHTETLWQLLRQYQIPTFLFINKMDLTGADKEAVMVEIKKKLSEECVDFTEEDKSVFYENLAMCEESMLEQFMEEGSVTDEAIKDAVAGRYVFPCFFGSALKLEGVEEFMDGLCAYVQTPEYSENFGARVYKIARDEQKNRLTFIKITGGSLRVKEVLTGRADTETDARKNGEKIDQIRLYSGQKYELTDEAGAGSFCVLTGPSDTFAGQGFGFEKDFLTPVLEPVLTYQILAPADCNLFELLGKLRQLEEEEPQLHIVWKEELQEIHAQVMGEVQIEILKSLIRERFGVEVEFSQGNVMYKETIANTVEGVGHYEPLRHYAEVHLLMEPLAQGQGLEFLTDCSEDELDKNWQRLILTHLKEKEHIGVLTGSPITDMRITLIAGKAHLKHTEGGDFRQATYRAVRQGLKQAESILLEPYFSFRMELPSDALGRAMTDVQQMGGETDAPEVDGETSVLTGSVPVAPFRDYFMELTSYTKGKGRLTCQLKGYGICHNPDEVIGRMDYESERDLENPTGSVFCSHGAGFVVPWDRVEEYMHLEKRKEKKEFGSVQTVTQRKSSSYSGSYAEDKELEAIFERTFGPVKKRQPASQQFGYERTPSGKVQPDSSDDKRKIKIQPKKEEYLLVDGYNIIFAWEELQALAKDDLSAARDALMDMLSNYQGFRQCTLIVVFDAYKVKGNPGEVTTYHNIHVVYTKEAETADMYIEKTVHTLSKKYQVRVATSDALEQMIIIGAGAQRLSAQDLKDELRITGRQIRDEYLERPVEKNYIDMGEFARLDKFFTEE